MVLHLCGSPVVLGLPRIHSFVALGLNSLQGTLRSPPLQTASDLQSFIPMLLVTHREGSPRDLQLENLDMTNNASTLIELKLAVIQYHSGENMDYLQKGIARDACYTSFNSLAYKRKMMADAIADFETAVTEGRDVPAERLCTRIENMEVELDALIERHEADKGAYTIISDGEEWSPTKATRNVSSDLAKRVAAMKAKVA